jgi:hypothetical protein
MKRRLIIDLLVGRTVRAREQASVYCRIYKTLIGLFSSFTVMKASNLMAQASELEWGVCFCFLYRCETVEPSFFVTDLSG